MVAIWTNLVNLASAETNKPQTEKEKLMSANTERLVGDLKDVMRDAEAILRDTAHDASDKAKAARERLMAAIESAKESCKNLEGKAIDGAKAADKVIRENPYQSIGIAFGVGLLVGYLATRK